MGTMIRLSFANIKLRKLRTVLTIVGIMIGVMSIVTMLTTGLGAKKTMIENVEKTGSTKEIKVYSTNIQRKDRLLTDSTVTKIEKLDNVEGVYPVLTVEGFNKLSGYVGWNAITGVPVEYMEHLNLKEGEVPVNNGSRPQLLIGNGVRSAFYNRKTWALMSESVQGESSLLGKKMDFALNDYSYSYATDTDAEPAYSKLSIVGEVDNEYDFSIYTDIDTLKLYLKRQEKDGRIPGQPTDKNGEAYNMWAYDAIYVRVDSVDNVEHVSKVLKDMGYEVVNNLESLKSVTRTISMIQFILGALGTIAAVVAIIGIVNTMMTAVYDRVEEIGLLKMLGSDSDDISFMFLFESAVMGFIGGALGVGLSLLADIYINKRLVEFMEMPEGTWMMTTPMWLLVGAVAASVVVAVLAGLLPARWASKIKPLDAIAMG